MDFKINNHRSLIVNKRNKRYTYTVSREITILGQLLLSVEIGIILFCVFFSESLRLDGGAGGEVEMYTRFFRISENILI